MECMDRLIETYSRTRSNREIRGKRDIELDLVNELVNMISRSKAQLHRINYSDIAYR